MAASIVCRRHSKQTAFGLDLYLVVVTLAFASRFSTVQVCGSSDGVLQYIPTLKDIYGRVPRNSFPIVRREASTAHRRGLRSNTDALTIPMTDVNSDQPEYFAQVQIGTPPQTLLLVIDTGSGSVWAQSKECTECYTELLPSYDPTISSTFEQVIVNGSTVPWYYSYVGGNGNVGYVAKETLTIPSGDGNHIVIPEFQFAVSVNNTGPSIEFSGVLGLLPTDPESVPPFLAQLETLSNGKFRKFSKKFRYCFPDRVTQYSTTSFLSFGQIDEAETDALFSSTKHLHKPRTLWTPLITNPDSYYALNMTAITVGGNRIAIDPQELTLESVQLNGVMTVIDSGTTQLLLREPYYSLFVAAYYYEISILVSESFPQDLNLNISQDVFDAYLFPTVSFIFQKWQSRHANEEIELFLPKDNVIRSISNSFFLNVANSTGTNTIGNFAQQNFLIEYDLENWRVGFLRASCTFDY